LRAASAIHLLLGHHPRVASAQMLRDLAFESARIESSARWSANAALRPCRTSSSWPPGSRCAAGRRPRPRAAAVRST